jgi:predicted NBD/HSP70 family sugar kinase
MNGPAFDGRALLSRRSDSLKDANKRRIIRAVMMDPGTQVTIARHTHLSQATVSAAVNDLVQEGVFVADTGEGERGKRVRLGPVRGVAVGVEVNHANVTVATRPVSSADIQYATVDFGADQAANLWVRQTVRLIQETVMRTGMGAEHIVSVGIGMPAAIDPRTSKITQVSSSLGWEMIGDPREQFEKHFPHVPIIVDNEANMAAYGEYVHGFGQGGYETMLFVKASEGIGAGLIVGGLIYRGRHGVAGEMGHLTMDPVHGIVCRCGNRGCLETQVGGISLLQQVQDSYRGFRIDSPTSLESMIERAKSGDPVCKRILMDAARKMGLGLARVCNLMNPEVIVLGGELGLAADFLLPTIEYELQLHALRGMFTPDVAPTRLVGSELGRQAGARGALSFAVQVDRAIPA